MLSFNTCRLRSRRVASLSGRPRPQFPRASGFRTPRLACGSAATTRWSLSTTVLPLGCGRASGPVQWSSTTCTASSQNGVAIAVCMAPSTAVRCSGFGHHPMTPMCTSTMRAGSTWRSPSPASSHSSCRACIRRARTLVLLLIQQRWRGEEKGARPQQCVLQLARYAPAVWRWCSARQIRAALPAGTPTHGGDAHWTRCSGPARSRTCSATRLPPLQPHRRHYCIPMAPTLLYLRSPPSSTPLPPHLARRLRQGRG
mmetsp:Transcript_14189/g.45447  ORF Transcript_14189/g.45447 Transcript_14189/m.45447 type:complete len:256 (-) Transcript_14189:1145-1912(-)